ncbi:MAG TPA: TadE/TadG family type IV pilus assembly protein [Novosphingobium sp.]
MRGRILSLFGALRRDRGGNALVEFAVAFPVLVLLYVGSFVMSDAIACNRKVTITARALTDLATRYSNLTQAEAATILSASSQVMSPYTPANAVIVLSEIKVTGSTTATVVWSKALNGTQRTQGSSVTIPNGMAAVDTFLILGEVQYTYTPAIRFGITNPLELSDTIMMVPRVSADIPLS